MTHFEPTSTVQFPGEKHLNHTDDVIAIRKVSDDFGWMGNMSPHQIEYAGQTWRSAEAAFQADRFEDVRVREQIRQCTSPMTAKFVAKRFRHLVIITPQSRADVANMRKIVHLKIEQHNWMVHALLATGARKIVEDCTKRPGGSGRFWGARLRDGRLDGQNVLGTIWMDIRQVLMQRGDGFPSS